MRTPCRRTLCASERARVQTSNRLSLQQQQQQPRVPQQRDCARANANAREHKRESLAASGKMSECRRRRVCNAPETVGLCVCLYVACSSINKGGTFNERWRARERLKACSCCLRMHMRRIAVKVVVSSWIRVSWCGCGAVVQLVVHTAIRSA